jgi:glycosyltransferase involved in cell wall biosynthesis
LEAFERIGVTFTALQDFHNSEFLGRGGSPQRRMREQVTEYLAHHADIAYVEDREALVLDFVRRRRLGGQRVPLVVTVMNHNQAWYAEKQHWWPFRYGELETIYHEKYAAQHSDFVAFPSQHMRDWAQNAGWKLPSAERCSVLPLPYLPDQPPFLPAANLAVRLAPPSQTDSFSFSRLAFLGRAETRRGLDLFVESVIALRGTAGFQRLTEIAVVGEDGFSPYNNSVHEALNLLRAQVTIPVVYHKLADPGGLHNYLAAAARDTLFVAPSRGENLSYDLIVASLVPGVKLLCANAGGAVEVFDALPEAEGTHLRWVEPFRSPLTLALRHWLDDGPAQAEDAPHGYRWQAANAGWLAFHAQVLAHATTVMPQTTAPVAHPARPASAGGAPTAKRVSVDVCIAHHNLGRYLPYTLEALAAQTSDEFTVIVVDDASTDPLSIEVFAQMRAQYAGRGWHFVSSTTNIGASGARNLAASLGQGEYLLFVDADNIPAPSMVERFLACIRASGDDCLTCYFYAFEGDLGHQLPSGLTKPSAFVWIPLGNEPGIGLLGNPFGDTNAIVRRTAFEALRGFTTDVPRWVIQEDHELFTRLSLAGYALDVIPEYLFYYRYRVGSRLRSADVYLGEARVARHYAERLSSLGLATFVPLILGMRWSANPDTYYFIEAHKVALTKPTEARPAETPPPLDMRGALTPSEIVDYLVHYVRWSTLLRGMIGKLRKNLNKLRHRLGLK